MKKIISEFSKLLDNIEHYYFNRDIQIIVIATKQLNNFFIYPWFVSALFCLEDW